MPCTTVVRDRRAEIAALKLRDAQIIVNQAVSELGAQEANIGYKHAHVRSSSLGVGAQGKIDAAQLEDELTVEDSSGLQGRLRTAPAEDFKLGAWVPAPAEPEDGHHDHHHGHVDMEDNIVAVLELTEGALAGSKLVVATNEEGYVDLMVDEALIGEDGEWVNEDAARMYDNFLRGVILAQQSSLLADTKAKAPTAAVADRGLLVGTAAAGRAATAPSAPAARQQQHHQHHAPAQAKAAAGNG